MKAGYFSIEALLEDEKFKASLKEITSATKKTASKSSRALKGISKSFKAVRKGAMIGSIAFASVYASVSKLTDIYHEKEAAEKRHVAILKSMGKYTKQAEIANIAYARSLQKITNFSDTDVLNTLNVFATFSNINNELAKKATKIALDQASVLGGGDSRSAAIQIGKALQDKKLATGLSRVGVNLDMEKIKQMTMAQYQKYVMDELQSEFGGASEASVNPVKQMKNSMADAFALMGQKLTPLFATLSKGLLGIVSTVSSVVGWFTDLFSSTTNWTYAIKELNVAVEQYNQKMNELSSLDDLVNRYEQLIQKTNLTTAEQKELSKITNKLSKDLPEAVKGWDAYGKALGIIPDVARRVIKRQKDIAKEALRGQTEKALKEASKVIKNWDFLKGIRKLKNNEQKEALSLIGLDETDLAKFSTEFQKLSKSYNNLFQNILSIDNVSDDYVETLYKIAKASGRTTDNFKKYKKALEEIKTIYKNLSSYNYKGFEKLNEQQRKALAQWISSNNRAIYDYSSPEQSKKIIENRIQKMIASLRNSRSNNGGRSDFIKQLEKDLESIRNMFEKLKEVNMLEIDIKLKENAKNFASKFGVLGKQKIAKLQAMIELDADPKEMEKLIRSVYRHHLSSEQIQNALSNLNLQRNKIRQEALNNSNAILDAYLNGADTLRQKYKEIEEERKKAIKALNEIEADYRRRGLAEEFDERYERQMKLIEQETKARKKAIEQEARLKKAEAVTNTISGIAGSFQSAYANFKQGGVSGVMGGIGNLSSQIPVVGKIASQAIGTVKGLFDTIFNNGETAEEKWQRVYEGMKAATDYQIYQQQAILRLLERQRQVIGYIDKLYSNDKDSLASKLKLEELQYSQEQASSHMINGTALADLTDEKKLAVYKEQIGKQSKLEQDLADARFFISQAKAGIEDLNKNYAVSKHDYTSTAREMYNKYKGILQEYGIQMYSFGDIVDKYGTPARDIAKNMSQFENMMREMMAETSTDLEMLEQYAEIENEIVNLREQENELLSENLGIQSKLTEELRNQLRQLNNKNINSMIDKIADIEYQMKVGSLDEATGNVLIKNYMSSIANQLENLGENDLMKAVFASRSDLLREINEKEFNALTGQNEVVQFHSGGLVTENGLAELAKKEIVLNPTDATAFRNFVSNLSKGENLSNTNINISSPFNITVKSETDLIKIEKKIYDIFTDIENRTGRKILSK